MSTLAQELIQSFDALPDSAKREAAAEILRRVVADGGDFPNSALDELAAERFAALDAEEEKHAGR